MKRKPQLLSLLSDMFLQEMINNVQESSLSNDFSLTVEIGFTL